MHAASRRPAITKLAVVLALVTGLTAATTIAFAPPAGATEGGFNDRSWSDHGWGTNKVEIYGRSSKYNSPQMLCSGGSEYCSMLLANSDGTSSRR